MFVKADVAEGVLPDEGGGAVFEKIIQTHRVADQARRGKLQDVCAVTAGEALLGAGNDVDGEPVGAQEVDQLAHRYVVELRVGSIEAGMALVVNELLDVVEIEALGLPSKSLEQRVLDLSVDLFQITVAGRAIEGLLEQLWLALGEPAEPAHRHHDLHEIRLFAADRAVEVEGGQAVLRRDVAGAAGAGDLGHIVQDGLFDHRLAPGR